MYLRDIKGALVYKKSVKILEKEIERYVGKSSFLIFKKLRFLKQICQQNLYYFN